jgi:GNAT superfamily N-acetyltransferase
MVARAFAEDPAWSYLVPDDDGPGREAFACALLVPRLSRGTAWVTDDCTAVAMWDRRADAHADAAAHDAMSAFRESVGERSWARVERYEEAVGAAAPDPPYWYLGVLAAEPALHGQGLATSVIGPGIAAADADGWDCWLETSTPTNKAFYAHRGFTRSVVVDDSEIPPTWWLRRPGQPARDGQREI